MYLRDLEGEGGSVGEWVEEEEEIKRGFCQHHILFGLARFKWFS
jgi:hypothetical protein